MSRLTNSICHKLQSRFCSNSQAVVSPNGIAHIQLSVSAKHWSESKLFYREWLNRFYGMEVIFDNETTLYCVGARTGVLISQCYPEFENDEYHQRKIGLHHICFRMRSNEDVEKTYDFLVDYNKKQMEKNTNVGNGNKPYLKFIRSPENGVWAPGYYSILFQDFDGIRWECNHVPNKGWLDPKLKNKLPHTTPYSKI